MVCWHIGIIDYGNWEGNGMHFVQLSNRIKDVTKDICPWIETQSM